MRRYQGLVLAGFWEISLTCLKKPRSTKSTKLTIKANTNTL